MRLARYAGLVTVVVWSLAAPPSPAQNGAATIYFERSLPQVTFADDEIRRSFADQGAMVKVSGFDALTAAAGGTRVVIAAQCHPGSHSGVRQFRPQGRPRTWFAECRRFPF